VTYDIVPDCYYDDIGMYVPPGIVVLDYDIVVRRLTMLDFHIIVGAYDMVVSMIS
jgi:hypothetical protein